MTPKHMQDLKQQAADLSQTYADLAQSLGVSMADAGRVLNTWSKIARDRPDMTWQDAYTRASEDLKERTPK